jgi:hypothetical protein
MRLSHYNRLVLFVALLCSPAVWQTASASYDHLLNKYQSLIPKLTDNAFGVPIIIEANGENGRMQGNVYGVLEQPYAAASQALTQAKNWCDITPLHFNVKACTWQRFNGDFQLTLYSGRKFYEKPESVDVLSYHFRNNCSTADYCKITLTAEDGPIDTSDYLFQIELIPLDGKTFMHFHYSYDYGFFTSAAMSSYFATLGAGKVGFTVTGEDDNGMPEYSTGVEGVMERNAMRYYLALQAYLESLHVSSEQRFEKRLQRWYDLTDRYRRQLYEMDRDEYLSGKRREYDDQQRLQQALAE